MYISRCKWERKLTKKLSQDRDVFTPVSYCPSGPAILGEYTRTQHTTKSNLQTVEARFGILGGRMIEHRGLGEEANSSSTDTADYIKMQSTQFVRLQR